MDTKPSRVPLEVDQPFGNFAEIIGSPLSASARVPAAGSEGTTAPVDIGQIQEKVVETLRTCFDPEIPVNIYELGLIYGIDVEPAGAVEIRMTLTSPACPAAGSLPPEVQAKVSAIPGVTAVKVNLVWDPPWSPDRMSEAAKLQLGFF